MQAQAGWYNTNANRTWPFTEVSSCFVPDSTIVDAGFIAGVLSEFDSAVHSIWLASVARTGDTFVFSFYSDAPGLNEGVFQVSRSLSDPVYVPVFVEADTDEEEPVSEVVPLEISESVLSTGDTIDDVRWEGFVVFGNLAELAALLTDGNSLTGTMIIEPGVVQNLVASYARSVSIANEDRTRFETDEDCSAVVWPVTPQDIWPRQIGMCGDLRLQEGIYCRLELNSVDNSITVSADVDNDKVSPCEQQPVFQLEQAPEFASTLDGSPMCNEVLRTVNGVGGRTISLVGGDGVQIEFDPVTATITVAVNMQGMAVCYGEN